MSSRLKKGDKVLVIAGNDRGKTGKVLARRKDRLVVEGVNMKTRHLRASEDAPKGRIVKFEGSIHQSNVQLVGPKDKGVRLHVRADKEGGRELFYQSGGKAVAHRKVRD